MTFVFDENMPDAVAIALRDLQEPATSVRLLGWAGISDDVLIARLAETGGRLLTRDRRMLRNPSYVATFRRLGVGAYFLHHGQDSALEVTRTVFRCWPELRRWAGSHPASAFASLHATGAPRSPPLARLTRARPGLVPPSPPHPAHHRRTPPRPLGRMRPPGVLVAHPHRGILIALEGIDGAGKTTQVGALRAILEGYGLPVVTTKEPTTDTEHGRLIRASAASERLPLAEELHAFVEDRRAHVDRLIRPALDARKVVIVDRYYPSTIAYQGARGADVARVRRMNEAFAPVPDLLVHIEIAAARGMARVRGRGEVSSFEREEELQVAGAIFAAMTGDHVLRVSGELPVAEVTATIMRRLVAGPLRRMLCADEAGELCDPPWCVVYQAGQCPWPALARDWGASA